MSGAADVDHPRKPASTAWRSTTSALCASLVGIGLARFAYTPLLPALIEAHWFAASDAAYLGAANLTGYLAGALLAAPMAAPASASAVLRAMDSSPAHGRSISRGSSPGVSLRASPAGPLWSWRLRRCWHTYRPHAAALPAAPSSWVLV